MGRVRIDLDHAGQILDFIDHQPEQQGEPSQHHENRTAVQMLAKGDLWLHPDAHGRCHSNLTCLPNELRGALRVEGEKLVCPDIRNSQPLILGRLIMDKGRPGGGVPYQTP